jgi:hypothetical protein
MIQYLLAPTEGGEMAGPDSPPQEPTEEDDFWEVPRHLPFARELNQLGVDATWGEPLDAAIQADHRSAAEAHVQQLVEQVRPALEARRRLVDLWVLQTTILGADDSVNRLITSLHENGKDIPEWARQLATITDREKELLDRDTQGAQQEWERLQKEHSEVLERLASWINVLKSIRTREAFEEQKARRRQAEERGQ